MKYITQFRYYGKSKEKCNNNYPPYPNPSNLYGSDKDPGQYYYDLLTAGNIFKDYGGITKLGIQSCPNTTFYLNTKDQENPYPIVIGQTGIYEIDLEGYGVITSIRFVGDTLSHFDEPEVHDRLLIDIVYEGSGVSV